LRKIIPIIIALLIFSTALADNQTVTQQLLNSSLPGTGTGTSTWVVGMVESKIYNPLLSYIKIKFPNNPSMEFWGTFMIPALLMLIAVKLIMSMLQTKIDTILWVVIVISIIWFILACWEQLGINTELTQAFNMTNTTTRILPA
jgi:hypothetical protein